MKRRVVVTGVGVVSSIGLSADECWQNCLAGAACVEAIPDHWHAYADFKSTLYAPLPAIDYAARGITRSERLQNDPVTLNALLAAREAVNQAGWVDADGHSPFPERRTGVFIGTGIGGAETFMENHLHPVLAPLKRRLHDLYRDDNLTRAQRDLTTEIESQMHHPRRVHPFMVSMLMPNTVAASLGIEFGIKGPNRTYALACSSGTVAVGSAFHALRSGEADVALAGGTEHFRDHHGYLFRAFDVTGALVQQCEDPKTANRPFDKQRSGFLWSQGGSSILVMETLDGALARGARILAEVVGFAESFDAHSMMAMAPDGTEIERVIRSSIEDAELAVGEIDYINAHGTGTLGNDQVEAEVIARVFGQAPLVNSTKSLSGHSFGASGALEAAVLTFSLRDQTTHANINLENPISDLNFATQVESTELNCGISQSFAFGGHNAAIVMKRFVDH